MMIGFLCVSLAASVCDFFANSFQQRLRQSDAFELAVFVTPELDADITMVAGIDHDLHHLPVVGMNLVAVLVELMERFLLQLPGRVVSQNVRILAFLAFVGADCNPQVRI
jgi:hypothetical protein